MWIGIRRRQFLTVTFCERHYVGYYGTKQFFQEPETGEFVPVENLALRPK